MNYEKYFEKTGTIYGISSKYAFGQWNHRGYKFTSLEEAEKWLHTEEYDSRERELMSKSRAQKLCGTNCTFEDCWSAKITRNY